VLTYRVNALTLLISIVLIGESSQPNVDIRLEALFDLIDFSSVSSITIEESVLPQLHNVFLACWNVNCFITLLMYLLC
jgi:hypothetical protein